MAVVTGLPLTVTDTRSAAWLRDFAWVSIRVALVLVPTRLISGGRRWPHGGIPGEPIENQLLSKK